jgi:hypothetical protein
MMMKKPFFFLVLLFIGHAAFSQVVTFDPPYKRFPEYPPVKLLLPDSVSYFTKDDLKKKTPILLMMFNPQCEHCQQETTELVKHIDEFRKIQIVMTTSMAFDSMLVFRERFKLADYENIVVGQDTDFFLFTYFQNRNLPFHAMYDKKKALIKVHEGSVSVRAILEMFKD